MFNYRDKRYLRLNPLKIESSRDDLCTGRH